MGFKSMEFRTAFHQIEDNSVRFPFNIDKIDSFLIYYSCPESILCHDLDFYIILDRGIKSIIIIIDNGSAIFITDILQ
jgi:hypothetical protein